MSRKRPDETRLEKAHRAMNEATYRWCDDPSDANAAALKTAVQEKRAALRESATVELDLEDGKSVARVKVLKGNGSRSITPPVINAGMTYDKGTITFTGNGKSTSADEVVKALESGIQEALERSNTPVGAGSSGAPTVSPPTDQPAGASAA